MKTNQKISIAKVFLNTLQHSWEASPAVFAALIVGSLLFCGLQVFEVYALRYFFDTVAIFATSAGEFADVLYAGLPLAIILLLGPLVEILEYLAQGYFWRRASGYLLSLFHLRTGKLRLIDFETTHTFDDMKKARFASEGVPAAARSIIQFVFYYLPFFGFTSVFLFTIKPLLVFALVFIFGSVLLSRLIRASKVYHFENQNAGLRRQTEYFENCITAKEYYKETRTSGVFEHFFAAFLSATERFGKASMRMENKIALIELFLRLINALGYAGTLGLLLYYLLDGTISVGAFASVFYSVDRINGILKRMVEDVGEALENMSISSFFFRFLQAEKDGFREEPLDKVTDIHLDNVSFAYPGGRNVLQGIHLDIRRGKTLAIVGENGAGKTTLTKLIMGLYQPSEGTVCYGHKNLNEYIPKQRFNAISSVFQNFIRYKLTARENIQISDIDSVSLLNEVIEKAGVPQDRFPQGLDTMLSREYDGTELSGGQWQRVAIARGFYRTHDVIILDEPTAAIDPIEESNIFRLFKESAQGKTAILVTHRLGSAKIADQIIVMEAGQIIERGSHAELMALGGKYCTMFVEQAKWYKRE
jgi:ATP-binding cassette subfamily B protein